MNAVRTFLPESRSISLRRLVGPAGARRLDPPDGPHRKELALKPHERRHFIIDDPGMGVRRHTSQQGGEELEPAPEPGPEHVVGCSFCEFPRHYLTLARRCQLQLDEAGRGGVGAVLAGFARSFGWSFGVSRT